MENNGYAKLLEVNKMHDGMVYVKIVNQYGYLAQVDQ